MVCKRSLSGAVLVVVLGLVGLPYALWASPSVASATEPPTATTPTSTTEAPPVTPPIQGTMRLLIKHAHGSPPFAVVGERVLIAGGVRPYVAGQKVVVSVYRGRRRVLSRRLAVSPASNGTGRFHLSYASPHAGLVSVKAEHVATAQLGAIASKSAKVRFLGANLTPGAGGRAVRLLQDELAVRRYEVPVNGRFDEATIRAVIAFRKVTGLPRVETVNSRIFRLLQEGAGHFKARYPREGNHVEADLSKQVLVELEPRGRVRRIFMMSSGKPSTPTVTGRFRVYYKTPGTNEKGMVDSNYFNVGDAIHGYAEVPTYAASHGCLRIPIPNAAAVFSWIQIGYPVDVYTE